MNDLKRGRNKIFSKLLTSLENAVIVITYSIEFECQLNMPVRLNSGQDIIVSVGKKFH